MTVKHLNQAELADRWGVSQRNAGTLACHWLGALLPEDGWPGCLPS